MGYLTEFKLKISYLRGFGGSQKFENLKFKKPKIEIFELFET